MKNIIDHLLLPFMLQMVIYNSFVYGLPIYLMWDDLGMYYDLFSLVDMLIPFVILTVVSMVTTLVMNGEY